ncbi:MAG: hypothetical protein E7562_00705 [Ruminococcaceae bacterium]|nr:hypothetical protein [Oscillospiraceae bacterium]
MEDILNSEPQGQPQPQAQKSSENEAKTKPQTDDIKISVKFNKKILQLTPEEAAVLSQKGMKYDQISDDYNRLRALAANKGVSVSEALSEFEAEAKNMRKAQLLESCGGNEALAEHIISLEDSHSEDDLGFAELKEAFPQFTSAEKLPESVLSSAQLRRTKLLDEYLRYCLAQKRLADKTKSQQKSSQKASIGSQLAFAAEDDPANLAFLQGLWRA